METYYDHYDHYDDHYDHYDHYSHYDHYDHYDHYYDHYDHDHHYNHYDANADTYSQSYIVLYRRALGQIQETPEGFEIPKENNDFQGFH